MTAKLDLLKELTEGEDEFDTDLMACGCRLTGQAQATLQVIDLEDIISLYGLEDKEKLYGFIATLIDECKIEAGKVMEVAEKVASGATEAVAT